MRYRCLLTVLALAVGLQGSLAHAGDPAAPAQTVALRWSLEKGAVFFVTHEQTLTLDVSVAAAGENQTRTRKEATRAVLQIRVENVAKDGTAAIAIRYLDLEIDLSDAPLDVRTSASLDGAGKLTVRAVQRPDSNGADRPQETRQLIEQIVSNVMRTRARARVTPDGQVREPRFVDDVFSGAAAEGEAAGVLRGLFDAHEFVSPVLAQLFVQLPKEPVAVGGTWKTSRAFGMAGMHVLGDGEAGLAAFDGVTATVLAKPVYDVVASGFEKRVADELRRLYKSLGDELELAFEFEGEKAFRLESEAEFDARAGHVRRVRWRSLAMDLAGKQRLSIFGRDVAGDMRIRMRGDVDVGCSTQPPPGITVPLPDAVERAGEEPADLKPEGGASPAQASPAQKSPEKQPAAKQDG